MSDNGTTRGDVHVLTAIPLTAQAFAPFGDVLEVGGPFTQINQGKGRRYADLAHIDLAEDGRTAVSLMTCIPETVPIPLRLMERHPKGNQVFMPVNGQRYIVVVAPRGEAPATAELRAFLCLGHQGINYHRGTWHHPMIVLDMPCAFLEVHWQGADGNCDEIALAHPVQVQLAS